MVFITFLILGFVSLNRIPLVLTPDIDFPFVGVWIPYPNATPVEIQETIVRPIEEALSTIPHVQRMTSRSTADQGFVGLFFNWGMDVDWLRSQVREKVEQVRADLPSDVDQIMVRNWSTTDEPIIQGQISSGRDLRGDYEFVELKIKEPLERLPGVAEVNLWGIERPEVDVYLKLDAIKRHRIDVDALFRRLDASNLNLSLGPVHDGDRRFGTITQGAVTSLETLGNFPVNDRGIRLSQIADLYFGSPAVNSGRHLNGQYAVGFEVRKTSQANTVETVRHVMAAIEELNNDPSLHGTQVLVWFNSGEEITRALTGLLDAGTIGALLAVVVLFFFLRRLGPTLVIGFAIPFSIIVTVGFLYLLGKTLNVLSMMGLMLATGMLVDNAVVVLESIFQKLEKGQNRIDAAKNGTRDVLTAVVAATLTSIIIFVPLVFGKTTNYSIWLSDTGTSIILALLCSLFISLTLIPLAVGRLLKIDLDKQSGAARYLESLWRRLRRLRAVPDSTFLKQSESETKDDHNRLTEAALSRGETDQTRIYRRYLWIVNWCLTHRFVCGFLIVPAIIGFSFYMLKNVPDNSPEAQDLQNLNIQYEFSENYHYAYIEEEFVNPVEDFLLSNRERFKIKDINSFYGNNEANTRIFFDKENLLLDELVEIRKQISEELPVIPGAEIKLGRQEGAEAQTWIGVNLYGEETATLQGLARDARRRLLSLDGFSEVHTDLDRGHEELQIRLDRVLARDYGLSPESVSRVLGILLRGQRVRGFRTDQGEVDTWVRLQPEDRESLEDLLSIVVGRGPDGQEILLSAVTDLQRAKTPGTIEREDRRTFTWMWVNYTGSQRDEGMRLVSQVMDEIDYPPGYGWSYGFWTNRQQSENRDFYFNLLFALFMVYFVMASLFESLSHPFAILTSLPFAMVGVTWMLYLTGTPFNMMAMIGLMVLLGIVVNNGIVMLDHINNLRRDGLVRREAILQGCAERFRPILMTASTTVVGLIPLALGTSSLFEMRYFPLARTVMGGLISATILTLLVLPTYYTLFDDLAIWLRRLWLANRLDRPHDQPATPEKLLPS